MALNNQILGNIASFADLETRISINRVIDEPIYRYSKKVSEFKNFERRVWRNEFQDCLNKIDDEKDLTDVKVRLLVRMFSLLTSDYGIKMLKIVPNLASNLSKKAFEAMYTRSSQWYHVPTKPFRAILKAICRKAMIVSTAVMTGKL